METFSEFLDVAGQCQGSVSKRSSAANQCVLVGLAIACPFTCQITQVRTRLSATKRSGSTDNESSSSALDYPLHFPVCKAALGEVGLWSYPLCRWGS